MVEGTLLERERQFERRDDLRAAGVTGKAINILESQPRAGQNARNRRRNMLLREWRDFPVEYDAETLRIDSPAHDVERVWPGVLPAHLNGGNPAIIGPEHASRRAVAEERGGDDIRLGQFVEPESKRANFDRDEQHNAPRARAGQARGDREPGDAARAAKSEDRNALDIRAKPQAPRDPRFETGR